MKSSVQHKVHRRCLLRPAFFFAFSAILFCPAAAPAQSVRIAAASDLQFAMEDLTARYQKQSNIKLSVTYGSSGNFFSQMQNGAPFDLFFSADNAYPQKLIDAGLADPKSLYTYAFGRIVLWARADARLDLAKDGFSALQDSHVTRVAIANPRHAPYGRAAIAALQKAGLYEQLKAKLVFGENISQAAQFVQSGSAQVGIIALSLAISPAMKDGERWDVPTDYYPPLAQAVVLLTSSANKSAALAFLEFVKSDAGKSILARHGFEFPQSLPSSGKKP